MSKVYVGDVGTEIRVDAGTDISTATSMILRVKKPDSSIVSWTATSYLTNYAKYVIPTTTTLDIKGRYSCNLKVTLASPAGSWTGETFEMVVYDNNE